MANLSGPSPEWSPNPTPQGHRVDGFLPMLGMGEAPRERGMQDWTIAGASRRRGLRGMEGALGQGAGVEWEGERSAGGKQEGGQPPAFLLGPTDPIVTAIRCAPDKYY